MAEEIDPELQELFKELDSAQGELPSSDAETMKLDKNGNIEVPDSEDHLESGLRPISQTMDSISESALENNDLKDKDNDLKDDSDADDLEVIIETDTVVNPDIKVNPNKGTEIILDEDPENLVAELEARKNKLQFGLLGLVESHYENADRLIDDVEADRKKCDDVYDILLNKIRSDDYRGADITALVTLLQTKADISRTRASMMAEVSKLLAALRNNDSIGGKIADDSEITPDQLDRLIGGSEPDDG